MHKGPLGKKTRRPPKLACPGLNFFPLQFSTLQKVMQVNCSETEIPPSNLNLNAVWKLSIKDLQTFICSKADFKANISIRLRQQNSSYTEQRNIFDAIIKLTREKNDRHDTGRLNWLTKKIQCIYWFACFITCQEGLKNRNNLNFMFNRFTNSESAKLHTVNSTRGDWSFPCYMTNRDLQNHWVSHEPELAYGC